ncbi:sensor histidine kinase [Streptomyces sp. NPDC059680]|uniref:sensor histidine kinase n=1 Tax=Streptomyces sp. NPDC059680 TaxID=3346904 RepID=UPI0036ABCAC2
MDWKLPFSPGVRRLLTAAALLALALTWVVDIVAVYHPMRPSSPIRWVPVFVTGPLAVLALPDTRWSPSLTARSVGVAAMSVALTCACLVDPRPVNDWGLLEGLVLLFLIVRVLAETESDRTTARTVAALVAAVLALPLRGRTLSGLVAGQYVLTVALALAVLIGCSLRALETRRRSAVQDVRYAERLALARDLHDLIAHHMTGIIVQANAARTVHAIAPEKVEPALEAISRSGTETLESMRRLVRVLREENHQALRPGDLLSELGDLVADFSRQQLDAPAARLEASAVARTSRFSPEVETSVVRVVQEALTNVHRHAPGERVTVRLDADPDWLHVSVANSRLHRRAGGPAGGRSGLGLIGLRERIEALDGTFSAGAVDSGQWEVRASVPRFPADSPLGPLRRTPAV